MLKLAVLLLFWININVIICEYVTIPELGTIKGSTILSTWTNKTIYQFLGIPFAESPVDELRFKPPIPKRPFRGVFDATQFGQNCPTSASVKTLNPSQYKAAEDCLSLIVYTRNLDKNANRPVMIMVHGGGFTIGSYNYVPGTKLLEKDIVYVAFNYRLGPLGFLSTDSASIPGNAGLLDTILAIKWVKKYIRNFGGDPNRITLFGESSGGGMVSALMLSPNEIVPFDLFQGAILASGSFFGTWAFDPEPIATAINLFRFVDKAKCQNPENMDKCFQQLDVVSLWAAEDKFEAVFSSEIRPLNPRITYSKTNFPVNPSVFLNGNHNIPMRNIALMAGANKNDGTVFIAPFYDKLIKKFDIKNNKPFDTYDLLNNAAETIGINDATGTFNSFLIKSLYTQAEIADGNLRQILPGLKDLISDFMFKAPVLKAAQAHAKYFPDKTYLYTFYYRGEYSFNFGMPFTSPFYGGVQHSDELYYLFTFAELNAVDTEMSKKMVDLWASFVVDGVPSIRCGPKWPPLKRFTGPYVRINMTSSVEIDFLDELTVMSRDAREKRISTTSS